MNEGTLWQNICSAEKSESRATRGGHFRSKSKPQFQNMQWVEKQIQGDEFITEIQPQSGFIFKMSQDVVGISYSLKSSDSLVQREYFLLQFFAAWLDWLMSIIIHAQQMMMRCACVHKAQCTSLCMHYYISNPHWVQFQFGFFCHITSSTNHTPPIRVWIAV